MPLVLASPYKKLAQADPYLQYVTLLMHMNGVQGSSSFIEETGKSIAVATATHDTTYQKFGTASAKFTLAGDLIRLPTSADFTLNGDFTIEAWVSPSVQYSNSWTIFDARSAGATGVPWIFLLSTVAGVYRPAIYLGTGRYYKGISTSIPLFTWTHVSVSRIGGVIRLFVNGVLDDFTVTSTLAMTSGTNPIVGSKDAGAAGYGSVGYIDELRLTNGAGRYVESFVPADKEFSLTFN